MLFSHEILSLVINVYIGNQSLQTSNISIIYTNGFKITNLKRIHILHPNNKMSTQGQN